MSQLLSRATSNFGTRKGNCQASGCGVRRCTAKVSHHAPQGHHHHQHSELLRCFSGPPAMQHSEYQGYAVKELSVTADLIQSFVEDKERPGTLGSEGWVTDLIQEDPHSKVVFDAHGEGQSMPQHLSTGLSGDHLVSLLRAGCISHQPALRNAVQQQVRQYSC